MLNLFINSSNIPDKAKVEVGTPKVGEIVRVQALDDKKSMQVRSDLKKGSQSKVKKVEFGPILEEEMKHPKSHM